MYNCPFSKLVKHSLIVWFVAHVPPINYEQNIAGANNLTSQNEG